MGIFSKIKLGNTENTFNIGFYSVIETKYLSNYLEGFYDLV